MITLRRRPKVAAISAVAGLIVVLPAVSVEAAELARRGAGPERWRDAGQRGRSMSTGEAIVRALAALESCMATAD